MFTIGVDVGGTNTDVAIINGTEIIGWSKSSTTEKITDGVVNSIKAAVENAKTNGYENVNLNIKRVNIGTTHFINAVIKRKNLSKVACIRLCGDASRCLPPFVDFPEDLREEVNGGYYMLNGGYQFNEEAISELNEKEIVDTIKIISKAGIEHIAVAGIFSPTNPRQEKIVGEILSQEYSNATYTLSHQLGHLGLLERENAAILNESLKELCLETVVGFKIAIKNIGLSCPVFFTQNDGTLISESQTLKFPVYTFSSGATNSMRGAAHLSSLKDAIIVDIGGTSTDVGVLMKGFPRDASSRVKVGGVNTNFRMPDTKSIGLGGGSIVTLHDDHTCSVGPSSVEYHITEKALIFGGDTLVATDVAVASGRTELGNKSLVSHLTTEFKDRVMSIIQEKVEVAVDTIKLSGNVCPVVLVGGGSILIDTDKPFAGASYVVKPPFYQIANAVGAALSQVSGTIDRLVTLTESNPREKQIESAKLEAIEIAVENGAFRDSCSIVDVSEIQMSYMVLPCVRLHVKAVGDLEVNVAVHSEAKTDVAPKISHKTVPDIKPIQLVGVTETKFASPKQASQLNKPNLTKNGEWIINLWDVDCLAIGAGILGCGGGGSPYLGRLRLKQCVEKGMQVKIVHPKCLKKDEEVYCVAFMGAPEVSHERIINGSELNCALKAAYTLQRHGFRKNMNNDQIKKIAKEKGFEIEITEKNTIVKLPKLDTSGKPAAIMVCEIGGLNAIEPLITGAELGIPILDCDGMGRAFPQLQHFAPFMYGACPYPATVTDLHGNYICCVNVESPTELENFFRQHCVAMGCSAGVCMAPLSSEDIQTRTCLYTLSQAWYLGNSVLSARQLHTCPIEEIMRQTNGKLLCQGKISNLERETKDGFTWGKIDIEGSGTYQNKNFVIEFQNEFIIAKSLQSTLATTPDLITVVDTDMGEPVTTDELKYGLRITALVLPSVPIMNSAKALEFVGPKAFKYENVEYRKACDYVVVESIPQYFGVE